MEMQAAVFRKAHAPVTIETVDVAPVEAGAAVFTTAWTTGRFLTCCAKA